MANVRAAKLPIFHAGSLSAAFAKVNAEFQKLHSDVEIHSQAAGSVDAIRWVTEEKRQCGILASADYELIPRMMFPDYAGWYINFASDEIVLCYTDKSRYHDQINADNWYEILTSDGVSCGRYDPNQDPGGYRALMVLQLAEKYYGIPGLYDKILNMPGNRILKGNLISMCESGELDYTFTYKAGAVSRNAKYVTLPEQINLGNKNYSDYYAQARVEITGSNPGGITVLNGRPILFALTIPKNYPYAEIAQEWIRLLLCDTGIAMMKSVGMNPFQPAIADNYQNLPESLRDIVI